MKPALRFGLLFVLAIALVCCLLHPGHGQTPAPGRGAPLSALRLDFQRLRATLDQGDVAGAVQQLEQGWLQQFEEYYQWSLRSNLLPPDQIAQSLSRIQRLTGQRSALVYAIAMVDFYQNLKTARTKVDALRATQLAMLQKQLHLDSPSIQQTFRNLQIPASIARLEHTDLSHPYYWAGFTMIGNPW